MKKLEYIFSLINSIFAYLFGGIDTLITTLIIFIVLDYITGVCKGIYRKELNSKKRLKGIIKKIGYLFIIILASLFDKITNNTDGTIRTITIYFFISNEAISILENWALMDLPLPKKLLNVFKNLTEGK